MPKANIKANGAGIGFGGLLTIVFIVLKLCGVITWPWIWVLSPIWISILLTVVFVILALLIAIAICVLQND
jgi:hypothetical protein